MECKIKQCYISRRYCDGREAKNVMATADAWRWRLWETDRAEDNVTVRLSAFFELAFSFFFPIISEFYLLFLIWFYCFFVFIFHLRSLSLFIVLYLFFLATVFICLFRDLLTFLPSFPFFFFHSFRHSFSHCSILSFTVYSFFRSFFPVILSPFLIFFPLVYYFSSVSFMGFILP